DADRASGRARVIVADVNLLAYLLLGGPETGIAQEVLEKDSVWAAPILWRSEFRSILAAFMRQRGLGISEAWQAHELADGLLGAHAYTLGGERVLQLVASTPCSAYDCEYVALAEELQVRLVTSDREVLRHFPRIAVSPKAFVRGTA
ncbi:MAG: type II toxin-antitoxin system VapC family toxin, partial [bacterium]